MKKEFFRQKENTNNYLCQYYPNHYGKKIADLNLLAEEAKKDFPELTDEDLEIVVFGGNSKKYIHGIRFVVDTTLFPGNSICWTNGNYTQEELNSRRYLMDSILN